MSACDTCPVPGHCCRAIVIGGGSYGRGLQTIEEAEKLMRCGQTDDGNLVFGGPMPFHPLFKRQDGAWVWWCPNLNAKTGRCDDYENRPFCCSDYEPKTDILCVLFEPENNDPETLST